MVFCLRTWVRGLGFSYLGSWVFELAFVLCGFAASRAESLRLSVKTPNLLGGYAARGAASKTSCEATESGQSRITSSKPKFKKRDQSPKAKDQSPSSSNYQPKIFPVNFFVPYSLN